MKQALVALSLVALVSSVACTRIDAGHVGIVIDMAGNNKGVQEIPTTTGWTNYNPVTQQVFEYPTFVQTVVWTANTAEGKPVNEEITFTNKDQMLISADINLSYHLEASKVPAFYVKFRSDDLNSFTLGYLRNTARDAFNEHAGKYDISQIMGDNAAFLKEVREGLQAQVAPIGVVIDQFGIIGAPRPPAQVIQAINDKVHATQLAQQKQYELAQVQAEMAKEKTKAETYANNTIITAQGAAQAQLVQAEAQAKANREIAQSLSSELINYKRLERWNGALPQVNGGSTNPFISLTEK